MKKLINPKTKEIAYLDLANRTIYFSKSKTTHCAIISINSETGAISKISSTTEIISKAEIKPKSSNKNIINQIDKPTEILRNNIGNSNNDYYENLNLLPLFFEMDYFEDASPSLISPDRKDAQPEERYRISA